MQDTLALTGDLQDVPASSDLQADELRANE